MLAHGLHARFCTLRDHEVGILAVLGGELAYLEQILARLNAILGSQILVEALGLSHPDEHEGRGDQEGEGLRHLHTRGPRGGEEEVRWTEGGELDVEEGGQKGLRSPR